MKCVIVKNKRDKKRGCIIKEEYIWDEIAKKWVPKMKVWPCADQLTHGSRARVKDSQDAVTRERAKIHVSKVYSVCKRLDCTLNCGIRYKIIVNVKRQERRIVLYRLRRKIFKIVKQLRCHSKREVLIIEEKRERRSLTHRLTENIDKISKYLWWHNNIWVLIIGENKVIYGNIREMGWIKNEYSFIMIKFMSFYMEDMALTLLIKLTKWYRHYGRFIKDCNFLSEKISYQYSKEKRKRRSRASGRKRLLHEGNKGENVKWQLWGISLYKND
jgi:hypothetical protein